MKSKTPVITAFSFALTALFATSAMASSPAIGMTSGQSGVTVDNSAVAGNATVLDGSMVQTSGFSRIKMNNGSSLGLGAGSKVQVFSNRVSLESGVAEVQSASKFEINARTLTIVPSDATSVARVALDGENRVLVTALNSPVNVMNREGILVARVSPNLPLSFLPQAAASGAFENTGCVLQKSGAAILTDQTGNQVFELRGADLRKAVGNTVHVKGTINASATPAGGASRVVNVTSSEVTAKGGCSAVATKLGAATSAAGLAAAATTGSATAAAAAGAAAAGGAAAGVGVSTAVIVGGVAAASAATVGGLAAAGTFSSKSN